MPKRKPSKALRYTIQIEIEENENMYLRQFVAEGNIDGTKLELSTTGGSFVVMIGERQFVLQAKDFIQAIYGQIVKNEMREPYAKT